MVLGIHLTDSINDNTLFINDISCAQRAFSHLAVHLFLTPSFVGFQDGQIGVGNKGEMQLVFLVEAEVRCGRVTAYAHHGIPQCKETLVIIAQVAGFGGAARSAVFGIELKHQLLAGIVGEGNLLPVLVIALKIRGLGTNL